MTIKRVARLASLLSALFLTCAVIFAALWHIAPDPLPSLLSRPVSPVLLDDKGQLVHARLSRASEWCLPVPLSEMGEWLPKVLVAVEDKRFYSHPGIDVLALGRALYQNALAGRVVSGASTISSQLARLALPRPRTLTAKIWEAFGALKLERALGKEALLEHYLNNAPFGGPIRGVEAAARLYFGKRARELSLGEAALLVGMLKGPTAYRPDKNPAAALKRRQHIIRKVAGATGFAPELTALALEEALPAYRPRMPDTARHFADLAFTFLPPGGGTFSSTLNIESQNKLQEALSNALTQAGPGVTAAGIIIDNRKATIIAYVGNALFDPARNRHWVDCATAPRSPGSTLKPFVYALAMDQGAIIPASLLADTPLNLSGEAPRNFDRRYRGPVSARTALADSLNAPAVRMLRTVGLEQALAGLRRAGFAHLSRPDDDYGDSLVLGAGEVTLLELARAYSSLARLGDDRPLLLGRPVQEKKGDGQPFLPGPAFVSALGIEKNTPSGLARRAGQLTGKSPSLGQICTPAAAYLVADILKDTGRLPFLQQVSQARKQSPAAFKTGTSFGLRDAWTVAYTPGLTVALWFGKEEGGPDPHLVGISLAAPTAMALLREMDASPWYKLAPGCGRVKVCALSGAAPAAACPTLKSALNITSVWPTRPCTLHVTRDGKQLLEWPRELEDFNRLRFAKDDLSRRVLIISPMPGARYLITPGAKLMPLAFKAEGVSYPVHWYVDGVYLGIQEREDAPLYWLPEAGEHVVSLLDAKERTGGARVTITDLSDEVDQTLPLLE